jgi:hypothetical protein
MEETYKLESKRGGSHAYRKQKTVITTAGEMPAAPKLNLLGGGTKAIGGQCNNVCSTFPSRIRNNLGENPYDKHAYCRRCSKYIFKELLDETKKGAKILCPCCHAFARLTPSTSAKNRTLKRRAIKE